eukprot:193286-Pyramimonas_sp.AAC.1
MPEAQRNRHVRGPISATIAYLLQAGWLPSSAYEWDTTNDRTQDRHAWNFSSAEIVGHDQAAPLLDEFVESLAAKQWREAAKLHCGEGVAGGVDCASYRQFLSCLGQAYTGRHLVELMIAIAVGGPWPNERKFAAKVKGCVSSVCDRCKEYVET